jgi:hypothetical protein
MLARYQKQRLCEKKLEEVPALEPIVAHGSRMSWAGLLRPGNEFAPARKSQLAVLNAESGRPLRRYFGTWSSSFRRFTTNLSTVRIKVRAIYPKQDAPKGIQCILHWVDRNDILRSDKGSVCNGDGWPKEFWDAFLSELNHLPKGTVAEKLRSFLDSNLQDSNKIVSHWRSSLRDTKLDSSPKEPWEMDKGLLPVPVPLEFNGKSSTCILSWSPGASRYDGLSEALVSPEAMRYKPDLVNQAKYYLECILAKLHGVNFDNSEDLIEDQEYARRPEVRKIESSFMELEKRRIADPNLGRLDRFHI